jgi:hypothetical protein
VAPERMIRMNLGTLREQYGELLPDRFQQA